MDTSEQLTLTEREKESLLLVAKGLTDGQAAQEMRVSRTTIISHLANARGKLGVLSTTAAVARAIGQGVIKIRID